MFSTIALLFLMPLASGYFYDGSGCTDWALRYNLPCSIKSANITVYTVSDAAPFVSRIGNGVPCGFDIDMLNLISYKYGINFQYKFIDFGKQLDAVQAEPNSIAMSLLSITAARIKMVTFAQYIKTASQCIAQSGYSQSIKTLKDLCGKTVVVETGTTQLDTINQQSKNCPSGSSINVVQVPGLTELLNAVQNNQNYIGCEDAPTLAYAVLQSNGALKAVGPTFDAVPYGIACNMNNRDLCCGFVNAINSLISQGVYQQLLEKYSLPFNTFGVCPSRLNLQGSTCEPKCALSAADCKAL